MPLRERNVLILAGGFAPEFSETPLLTPTLDRMRGAIRDAASEPTPVLNLVFRSPAGELRFFETMTTFIGPRDVTLEELRIECSFPADERTGAVCEQLGAP